MKLKLTYAASIRNTGNNWYKKYKLDNEFIINKKYLENAINCYENSLKNSENSEDLYKATKNLSIAYDKYTLLYSHFDLNEKGHLDNYIYALKFFVNYFLLEIENSKKYFKDIIFFKERNEKLIEQLNIHLEILKDYHLFNWIYYILDKYFKKEKELFIKFMIKLAEYYFNYGFILYESNKIVDSKQYFNNSLDMISILENKEYESLFDQEIKNNINDIKKSDFYYIRGVSAKLFINEGDKFLEKCFFFEESVQMDYFFDSIDQYRNAYYLYCNDEDDDKRVDDLEMQAISLFKIADAFYKIIKRSPNLYKIVMSCINLGLAMYPVNVEEKDWYKRAKIIATVLRNEKLREEKQDVNELKEKYKKEHKDIFDNLKKIFERSKREFIRFILQNYPYNNFNGNIDNVLEEYDKNSKKCLLKLSAGYHPDKYTKETQKEQERVYIIEEIESYINSAYNNLKG